MGLKIYINKEKCDLCRACEEVCPFNAIEISSEVVINAACKMCRICAKKCPKGAISFIDQVRDDVNRDDWKGVLVFVEHMDGDVHPVTYELIGKGRGLADKISQPLYCIFIGNNISDKAKDLLNYGVDKVFIYDNEALQYFRVDIYSNAFEDCINNIKPSIILVGATSIGRSLAPRLAARFRTGLTADCTVLDVKENTDLVQIRPAFGGNIMAQISTPYTRPQFATVRYKVMDKAIRIDNPRGVVESYHLDKSKLKSAIKIRKVIHKEKIPGISEAEVLVVGGRGLKTQKDLEMLDELAKLLGGQLATTRALVEAGWAHYTKQIGLSGRTVKPKLIITCGVSGAVQFTACMNSSEVIFAINQDKNAPIFKVAHYGIVGDLYEVIPMLIEKIKKEADANAK